MVTRFFAAVGRHRRIILVAGMAVAVGYLLVRLWVPSLGRRALPVMAAVSVAFLLLGAVAAVWERAKVFVVQPHVPAFSTPPQPAFVLLALGFLSLATGMVGNVIRDWATEPFLPDQLLELGYAPIVILLIAIAWRDTNVQLRPDGLWQRGITGWLVVPWDASPTVPTLPPSPNANTVRLEYGHRDLVRRHGLHVFGHRLRTHDIDPRLLTAAIRYYVEHPEHRPAIGTRAEYDRVMPQLPGSPATRHR